jgi:hypothetical protein
MTRCRTVRWCICPGGGVSIALGDPAEGGAPVIPEGGAPVIPGDGGEPIVGGAPGEMGGDIDGPGGGPDGLVIVWAKAGDMAARATAIAAPFTRYFIMGVL